MGLDSHGAQGSAGDRNYHVAVCPQLTLMIWPVMNDALPEARNVMASAISSGFAPRFSGTAATNAAFLSTAPASLSATAVRRSSIAVSVGPGATALTRTPKGAPSRAADFVSPSTACLLAV